MKRYPKLLVLMLILTQVCLANVFYRLEGIVTVHDDAVALHTSDGRVFTLDVDRKWATKYEGKNVLLEGYAKQADQTSHLRVQSVKEAPIKDGSVVLPEYHIRQKQPILVSQNGSVFEVANVRCGFNVSPKKEITEYFWKNVTIKSDLVDQVYFIRKPFAPEWIAAHSCLLFTFKPGGMVDATGRQYKGFLVSVEAHLTTTQKYSLKDGLFKKFGAIWLLVAWEDYSAEACDARSRGSGKLYLYPVKFSHEQKSKLVQVTIDQAVINRQGEFYHTIRNNCTNSLVVLLNQVMTKKVKLWAIPSLIYNLKATMPIWVPEYLQKKGILDKALPEINVNNYFVDLEKIAAQKP